jgi:quinol monooxygenase YgiN
MSVVEGPFVVVDTWLVRPGKRDALEATLADAARWFRAQPDVLSVEFNHIDGNPDRYLAVFRYRNLHARDTLQKTTYLSTLRERLQDLWDVEIRAIKGHPTEL